MSELDPVTFLIATELLAGFDRTSTQRRTLAHDHRTISSPTLILLAQGSPDVDGDAACEDLCLRAQRDFGLDCIRTAYLEFNSPSLPEVVEDLLSRRIHRLRVLPLFLSEVSDAQLPEMIRHLREKYAALEIELLPPIGADLRFQRLLWQIVRDNVSLVETS